MQESQNKSVTIHDLPPLTVKSLIRFICAWNARCSSHNTLPPSISLDLCASDLLDFESYLIASSDDGEASSMSSAVAYRKDHAAKERFLVPKLLAYTLVAADRLCYDTIAQAMQRLSQSVLTLQRQRP